MRVLVIGSGAREHALAAAVARDGAEIYSAGPWQNPGITAIEQQHLSCAVTDIDKIAEYARYYDIDLALPGGEASLAAGIVDALRGNNINCVGPEKNLALLESSKSYTRKFLDRHRLAGNPRYFCVDTEEALLRSLTELAGGYVLKADGLCGGKGVKIAGQQLADEEQAVIFGRQLLAADGQLVVEELLMGQEFSLLSFADGSSCVHAPLVQDHKRAYDGDQGPNTGGMGSYALASGSLPFVEPAELLQARQLNENVLLAIAAEYGQDYRGVLYGSYMVTGSGLRLIEFNVRYGDPEILNLVNLLNGSWLELLTAISTKRLAAVKVEWQPANSLCKYLVPEGYPDNPIDNGYLEVAGLQDLASLYWGAVQQSGSKVKLLGSRAAALVVQGRQDFASIYRDIEHLCGQISGPVFHRPDIGSPQAMAQKIDQMAAMRRQTAKIL